MSTRDVTSKTADSTVAAEVMARRTKSTERSPEIYGAETLPVLIRLPDLTLANRAVNRLSASAVPEEVAATVTDPVDAAPDLSPPRRERERYVSGAVRQDRPAYGGRRVRRGIREDQPVGWLHGVRQFLVAAVLAGILLAVIVTIKEWNQAPPKPTSVAPREHVEVSPMDFGQPELAPAANATREPRNAPMDTVQDSGHTLPGAVPAGMISFDSGPSPYIENTRPTRVDEPTCRAGCGGVRRRGGPGAGAPTVIIRRRVSIPWRPARCREVLRRAPRGRPPTVRQVRYGVRTAAHPLVHSPQR